MNTGEVKSYIYEPGIHNKCEVIFSNDENYIYLESSAHNEVGNSMQADAWKLKRYGSVVRVMITRMVKRRPCRLSNPVVNPDGKWLSHMINLHYSKAGCGMRPGLFDVKILGKAITQNNEMCPKI